MLLNFNRFSVTRHNEKKVEFTSNDQTTNMIKTK